MGQAHGPPSRVAPLPLCAGAACVQQHRHGACLRTNYAWGLMQAACSPPGLRRVQRPACQCKQREGGGGRPAAGLQVLDGQLGSLPAGAQPCEAGQAGE